MNVYIYSVLESFSFTLASAEDPTQAVSYTSRDEFLYGDNGATSYGFIIDSNYLFGTMNLYYNAPYAKCNGDEGTLYARSGDFAIARNPQPDGSSFNDIAISRSEYTFERETNGKRKNSEWKLKSGYIAAKIFQEIYVAPSDDDTST